MTLADNRRQGASKVDRDVSHRAPGGKRISEYLAAPLLRLVSRLVRPTAVIALTGRGAESRINERLEHPRFDECRRPFNRKFLRLGNKSSLRRQ